MESLEVLFEMNGSRKVLCVGRNEIVYTLENEIGLLGIDGILAYFSCVRGQSAGTKKVYILQKWSDKWNAFIDVTDTDQIVDGDRLTIIPQDAAEVQNGTCTSGTPPPGGFDTTRGQVCKKFPC